MVFEEVHGVMKTGSHRRIDIIVFTEDTSIGYIFDPTVKFDHKDQLEEVNKEKQQIYEPTTPYYLQKYHLKEIQVYGMLIEARGHVVNVKRYWD